MACSVLSGTHASCATSLKSFWENTCTAVADRLCSQKRHPYLGIVLERRRSFGSARIKKKVLAYSGSLGRHTLFQERSSFVIEVPLHPRPLHERVEVVLKVGCRDVMSWFVYSKKWGLQYRDAGISVIVLKCLNVLFFFSFEWVVIICALQSTTLHLLENLELITFT